MNLATIPGTCDPTTKNRRLERQHDALATRVRILEAKLAAIAREADLALAEPGVAFLVTRRVATLARQAFD